MTLNIAKILAPVCLIAVICLPMAQAGPTWWETRGVIDPNDSPKDYGAVNMGQFRWMITNAYDELERMLPNGASNTLDTFVLNMDDQNNAAGVNQGQLKYVAEMFFNRLEQEGYTSYNNWTTNTTADDKDYGMVNNGQLKWTFDFDPGTLDSDSDGLNNAAESGSGTFNDPNDAGSSMTDSDSDGDGTSDGDEVANRTDPNNADVTAPVVRIDYPTHMQVIRWVP